MLGDHIFFQNSFVIIYLVFQFTKLFDQIRSFGDVLATGKRIVEIGAEIKKENPDLNSESIVNGSDLIVNDSCRDDDVINLDQIVCVSGLTNSRPRKLFEKMSFELGKGQSMIIEGENGTGKTSLSRLLAGLWRADQGKVPLLASVWMTILSDEKMSFKRHHKITSQCYVPARNAGFNRWNIDGTNHLSGSCATAVYIS